VIDRREDLAGLPPDVIGAAADAAKAARLPGKWVFGLQSPSIWPFLSYADNRELRAISSPPTPAAAITAISGTNKRTPARQASLRQERSQLLGYRTFADFTSKKRWRRRRRPSSISSNRVWTPARAMAIKEAAALQEMGATERRGFRGGFTLQPWDWRYYTEKIRKSRYDLDEEALRPYFSLDRVRDGAFAVANKLYGLTFTPRPDLLSTTRRSPPSR